MPCCQLQCDLAEVQKWADTWASTLNAEKSAHERFSKRHLADETPQVFLNSTAIAAENGVKHLGVRLTQSLQWSAHVKMLMQQTSHKLYTLKCLAHRTAGSKEFVQHLYLTIVRPTLEHTCAVWANCSRSDMTALERIQLSFVLAILHLPRRTCSNRSVLSLVGWPTPGLAEETLPTAAFLAPVPWRRATFLAS